MLIKLAATFQPQDLAQNYGPRGWTPITGIYPIYFISGGQKGHKTGYSKIQYWFYFIKQGYINVTFKTSSYLKYLNVCFTSIPGRNKVKLAKAATEIMDTVIDDMCFLLIKIQV